MKSASLQNKLIISFTAVIGISFLIMMALFYGYMHRYIKNDVAEAMEDIAAATSAQLDNAVYNLDRIALGMLGSREIIDGMTKMTTKTPGSISQFDKFDFQREVDRQIFTLNTPLFTSPMVSVINPDYDLFFSWSITGQDRDRVAQRLHFIEWEARVHEAEGGKVLIPPRQSEWTTKENRVFSVARAVRTSTGQDMGILEVQQYASVLDDICAPQSDSWLCVVLDGQGSVIYPASADKETWEALSSLGEESGEARLLLGDNYIYTSEYSSYTGWRTFVLRPKNEIFRAARIITRFILYAAALILVLAVAAIVILSRSLTMPLRRLGRTMEAVDIGNMSVLPDDYSDNDEIARLNLSFQSMIERIDQSLKQAVQAKSEESRAYLLALQSQMNPHFLYNTLNTIAVLAEENGQSEIDEICRHLVSMLRYVSDYSHSRVTLEEELCHTRRYLRLLKTRYEDGLSFRFITKGTLEGTTVPRLILQPLVENSYRHGLCSVQPPWEIEITVCAFADGFSLLVRDNGRGFMPGEAEELAGSIQAACEDNTKSPEKKTESLERVGILNTYMRLYLEYGENITLKIGNNESGGAYVLLSVGGEPALEVKK